MNGFVPAFRLTEPVIIDMVMYDASKTLDLYSIFGRFPDKLHMALENKMIVPLSEEDKWYLGPSRTIFWNRGIFTEKQVREVLATNKKFSYIGNKREEEIVQYLNHSQN